MPHVADELLDLSRRITCDACDRTEPVDEQPGNLDAGDRRDLCSQSGDLRLSLRRLAARLVKLPLCLLKRSVVGFLRYATGFELCSQSPLLTAEPLQRASHRLRDPRRLLQCRSLVTSRSRDPLEVASELGRRAAVAKRSQEVVGFALESLLSLGGGGALSGELVKNLADLVGFVTEPL